MKHARLVGVALTFALTLAGAMVVGGSEQAARRRPRSRPAARWTRSTSARLGRRPMSGRISDVAVYEANPAIYYVATAHGGVWKTRNNGTTFEAQLQDQGLMSIGDVTISQSNPDLVWVGTGESNNRQSTSWATGSTSRQTAGRRTPTWGFAPRSTSTGSSSTRATTTSCSWRPPGACGALAASAASIAPPTAARPGRRCSRSTMTPARTTS